jgi:L-aspartate oxidase
LSQPTTRRFDFLVLGSGVAGLTFALRVADRGSVAVVTKKESAESNTNWAQGGIAAVVDPGDSLQSHIDDTLDAGAGLCDEEVVRIVVTEGPQRLQELIDLGADFSRDPGGDLHLGREGGHSANRIVHAADATGAEIERALLAAIRRHPNIHVFEYHYAVELITEHHLGQTVTRLRRDTTCFGAYVLDEQRDAVDVFLARATLLATGGSGQVYAHTTNPDVATADGLAMAYRAKAHVANMEFVQFHPTSLYGSDADSFLISEAVRGEGGILTNLGGERFMPDYDPRAELAPRDIVARAIDDQIKRRGDKHVWLDISHIGEEAIEHHFPTIRARCLELGIDITREPIPVVPAAHYQCGGVVTDLDGRTTIDALYASGEVAYTGLHGANRLASNSLLEAMVFSHRAARHVLGALPDWSDRHDAVPPWDDSGTSREREWVLVAHNREELQRTMSDLVGIVRSDLRLERALRRTRLLYEETEDFYRRTRVSVGACELRNLIACAYLIIRSALMRRESRGLHYTLDYPEPRPAERRPTVI